MSVLELENISYRYSDAPKDDYVFKNINYSFESGKVYAIKGKSGSGKTTLLSLISGLERCTEGKIIYDGKDLKKMNLDVYRNSNIGIVFQSYNLLPYLTAIENIVLAMDISKQKITDKKAKALDLMKKVGLSEDYAKRKILRLSGGEQQRIAIARSLAYDAKVIVADEPTGNLDKETENDIIAIFKDLAKKDNKCIIIVTHSDNVCDQADIVYELKKNKDKKEDIKEDKKVVEDSKKEKKKSSKDEKKDSSKNVEKSKNNKKNNHKNKDKVKKDN